jgi:hypothetical protein
MKALVCEMCGSADIIKDNGFYVCQSCGVKYTVEEARKMMVEGVVKIDKTDDIKSFLELGMSSLRGNNGEQAMLYANRALEIDPKCTDAWLIKMYSIQFLGTVGNPRLQEMVDAGANAVSSADNDFGVEEKVCTHYIDRGLELLSIATSKLKDTKRLKEMHNANAKAYGWTAVDKTANYDTDIAKMYDDLAGYAVGMRLFVSDGALKRSPTLRNKLRQLGREYEQETIAVNERYRIYGRKLLPDAMRTRDNIVYEINNRIEKAEQANQKEKNENYWEEHQDLRKQLEDEKNEAKKHISDLKAQINAIPGMKEKMELESQLAEAEKDINSYGVFDIKRKKEKREQILDIKAMLDEADKIVKEPLQILEKKISEENDRIERVENQLNKNY